MELTDLFCTFEETESHRVEYPMVDRVKIRFASPLPQPPLLSTESTKEFEAVRDAMEQEIRPRGIIEQIYVADFSYILWEIERLRRCKAATVNMALRTALENVL